MPNVPIYIHKSNHIEFTDLLTDEFYSFDIGYKINSTKELIIDWTKVLNIPDVFVLETLDVFLKDTELILKKWDVLYEKKVYDGQVLLVLLLRNEKDLIHSLDIALQHIKNGCYVYLFINKNSTSLINYRLIDGFQNTYKFYEHSLILSEVGLTFITQNKKYSTINKICETLPKYLEIEIS